MDRLTINRFLHLMKKNIPVITFAGMFFFCTSVALADSLLLAIDLFEKNEWALCRRECRRAVLKETKPIERFQVLNAMSAVRMEADIHHTLKMLELIIEENREAQATAIASYEAGRLYWQLDQPKAALNAFSNAFYSTTDKALFLRSACSVFLLFKEHSYLKKDREELVVQITTSRSQWFGALFNECAKPDPNKNQPEAPNWIIRFYRSQIRPAIGDRCVLDPSCSEYYHQAHKKHGWKSLPMIADRFYREPEVSQKKADPVIMEDGQIRYRDPIENHDFWMKNERK